MIGGAVADLARFKIDHPLWTVTRAGVDLREYEARRRGLVIRAASLSELGQRIRAAERHPPS